MPWKKSEPMDQRREFALKALRTLNFRTLCQEYGISAKMGCKWRERPLRQGLEGMGVARPGPPNAGFPRTDFSAKNTKKPKTKTVTT
jgi:hypothetical protein